MCVWTQNKAQQKKDPFNVFVMKIKKRKALRIFPNFTHSSMYKRLLLRWMYFGGSFVIKGNNIQPPTKPVDIWNEKTDPCCCFIIVFYFVFLHSELTTKCLPNKLPKNKPTIFTFKFFFYIIFVFLLFFKVEWTLVTSLNCLRKVYFLHRERKY